MELFLVYAFFAIGIIGCLMFAFCNAPQVRKTYSDKNADGLSSAFLVMQLLGNIFNFLYIEYTNLKSNVWQYPMYVNYATALVLVIVLIILKDIYDNKNNKQKKNKT